MVAAGSLGLLHLRRGEPTELSAITARCQGEELGSAPYQPRMMVKVLLYGYCTDVASSRRIVQSPHEDIASGRWRPTTPPISAPSRTSAWTI